MYLNTSGNKRDGDAFVLVKRDDREYHIYGTGKNREIFSVKDPASKTTSTDTRPTRRRRRRRPPSPTDDRRRPTTGTTPTGPLVTDIDQLDRSGRGERRRDLRRPSEQLIGHEPGRRRPERDPPRAVPAGDRQPFDPGHRPEQRPSVRRARPRARPQPARLDALAAPAGSASRSPAAPGASASASGRSCVNVEPTAEMPRAVTAENSAVGAPSSLVSASIPTSSSTCRGASGQLELDHHAP